MIATHRAWEESQCLVNGFWIFCYDARTWCLSNRSFSHWGASYNWSRGNCPNDRPSWVTNVILLFWKKKKKDLRTVTSSRIQIFDNNLCYFAHSSECFSWVTSNENGPFIVPPCVLDKMQTPCACCFSKTSAEVLTDT